MSLFRNAEQYSLVSDENRQATTEILTGLSVKYQADQNRWKIRQILTCLDVVSALCGSFIQGTIATGITENDVRLKDITEKVNRMPMDYFDTKPVGRCSLPCLTNDGNTLGQSLNQSATLITSVTTHGSSRYAMLSISPLV